MGMGVEFSLVKNPLSKQADAGTGESSCELQGKSVVAHGSEFSDRIRIVEAELQQLRESLFKQSCVAGSSHEPGKEGDDTAWLVQEMRSKMSLQQDWFTKELLRASESEGKFREESFAREAALSARVYAIQSDLQTLSKLFTPSMDSGLPSLGKKGTPRSITEPTSLLTNPKLAEEVLLVMEATSRHIHEKLEKAI